MAQLAELTGKPELLKKINLVMVADLIRKQGPISRADIAKTLGISRPTVSKLTAHLLEDRAIVEIGEGLSNGGKKPILLQINGSSAYVVGIHMSYPACKVALADNLGNVLAREEAATETIGVAADYAAAAVKRLLKSARLDSRRLSAIAVAVSGIADPSTGEVLQARHVPQLQGTGLKRALEAKFGVPVWIDNDVYMGLISQSASLDSQPRSVAYVSVGKLIGLGLMIEGRVYRGARLAAGEIGDMLIDAGEQLKDGYSPEGGYLERWLGWPADSDNGTAQEAQRKIACCLANVVSLFDPERLVVGGEILSLAPSWLGPIECMLRQITPRAPVLETAHYRDDAELMGGVFAAIRNLRETVSLRDGSY